MDAGGKRVAGAGKYEFKIGPLADHLRAGADAEATHWHVALGIIVERHADY